MNEFLNDKGKRTLVELLFGIAVINIIAMAGNFFFKNKLAYTLGILLGCAVACFMCIHMYKTLEKAMLCDDKKAKSKTKLSAFLRMLVMVGALIAGVLLPEYISLPGVMIGIISLKVSALLQPLTDKLFFKLFPQIRNNVETQ